MLELTPKSNLTGEERKKKKKKSITFEPRGRFAQGHKNRLPRIDANSCLNGLKALLIVS
jgi:hypothetical protein